MPSSSADMFKEESDVMTLSGAHRSDPGTLYGQHRPILADAGKGKQVDDGPASSREIRAAGIAAPEAAKRVFGRNVRGKSLKPHIMAPFTVGKAGVLSKERAEDLERTFFERLQSGSSKLQIRLETEKERLLEALWIYLAINGGSVGTLDGFSGTETDVEPITVGDIVVHPVDVQRMFGASTYSYMRYRATEIKVAVESVLFTLRVDPNPDPGIVEIGELLRVAAVKRGLSAYPQYVAVGSEYAHGTPDSVAASIIAASAGVLKTSTNVREEIQGKFKEMTR